MTPLGTPPTMTSAVLMAEVRYTAGCLTSPRRAATAACHATTEPTQQPRRVGGRRRRRAPDDRSPHPATMTPHLWSESGARRTSTSAASSPSTPCARRSTAPGLPLRWSTRWSSRAGACPTCRGRFMDQLRLRVMSFSLVEEVSSKPPPSEAVVTHDRPRRRLLRRREAGRPTSCARGSRHASHPPQPVLRARVCRRATARR